MMEAGVKATPSPQQHAGRRCFWRHRPQQKAMGTRFGDMNTKKTAGSVLIVLAAVCGGCRGTEHTEAVTAEITAAQMEGRTAARDFIQQDWRDTSKVAARLDTIERRKEELRSHAKDRCAEAYDSAFTKAVRAVNPPLGRAVDKFRLHHAR